ncbi:DUF6063 family protein [Tepidibacillus marianensis]|uniref:DUF6063 family protein n=1 Tax=Tepidibacillus marianensis TaxID=3131995 RepID=UPI0030CA7567
MVENQTIMKAFDIYTLLAKDGLVNKELLQEYLADDHIRGLVDQFAGHVDSVNIIAGDQLYMIPETKLSIFHVSNEYLRKTYFKAGTNTDLYLMYFSIMVLIGEFYNSYTTTEVTRDFIQMDEWVRSVNQRVESLKEHSEEELKKLEKEYSYNWTSIIEKWETMDELKETAKKQSGNTISRLSFLDTVKRFMIDQDLVIDLGNNELTLTEKAKTIVQRYFMELEYNRGVLEFLYQFNQKVEGEEEHAIHL